MSTGNTSLGKMLALLDAFNEECHVWTVEALAARFGYTQPSTYRYVRELCRSGLLVRMPNGDYVIGARVVELDALISRSDPLTEICMPMLESISKLLGCHALLSNVYGQHLINVAHVAGNEAVDLKFVRGRRLPWFRGATSNAILAFLPRKRVRKLFEDHYEGEKSKENWKKELAGLNQISACGFSLSDGGLQPGVVGIGAPVVVRSEVMGSISLVFSQKHGSLIDQSAVGKFLIKESTKYFDSFDGVDPIHRS
ncbi:MAG: helix-turn-helix domain-containing protein [Hyphomicrobiales bacterium]|nr:helix-turn-helix domain-containing protein [Hyphomicrobiales bacterium]